MPIGAVNSIQSNVTGEMIARVLTENSFFLQKSLARLSTGFRVLSAGDDPAQIGTAIKFGNQIARIGAAQTAIENATSFSESQGDFLDKVSEALDRMSELAVLAQSSTVTAQERTGYIEEFQDLQAYISDIGSKNFNGISLFGGSDMSVVVDEDARTFTLQTLNYNNGTSGLATAYNLTSTRLNSTSDAATAEANIDAAINNLGIMQAKVGGNITRLELETEGLSTFSENLTAARDAIMAVDIASESTELARLELLTQSGIQAAAQWNVLRTNLLRLFQ